MGTGRAALGQAMADGMDGAEERRVRDGQHKAALRWMDR